MSQRSLLTRRHFLAASLAGAGLALPSAAGAQALLADLRGSLDVSSLGVRPGALDNQSAALQAAIDEAARDGQPLFLSAGDYVVSNIDLPSGLSLIGVPGRTRIRYAGDGHLMFATNVSDVRLEGLVLDGDNRPLADYAPALLHISTGAQVTIDACTIQGSHKDGIVFDRVSGSLERSTISGARGTAFRCNDAAGLALRDNTIEGCAGHGLVVLRWRQGRDATLIAGNRITGIGAGHGISLFRADGVIVSGNTLRDSAGSAVRCDEADRVQVRGNTSTRSGDVALRAGAGSHGLVVPSNIVESARGGIAIASLLDGSHGAVVQGNVIRNLTMTRDGEPHDGTGIAIEADASVTGNLIEDAAVAGISAGWGPNLRNVIVAQNIIRRAPVGVRVSVVEGVGASVIRDNIMDETPDGAVIGMRWGEPATGELSDARRLPAQLTVQGNRRIA